MLKILPIHWERLTSVARTVAMVSVFVSLANAALLLADANYWSLVGCLCSAWASGWLAALGMGALNE